jgi:S-phase kinase-associated protein 1
MMIAIAIPDCEPVLCSREALLKMSGLLAEFIVARGGDGKSREELIEEIDRGDAMDEEDNEPIPVYSVPNRATLVRVVEFMEHHKRDPLREIEKPLKSTNLVEIVGDWDAAFIDVVHKDEEGNYNMDGLVDIRNAATYLDIPQLIELVLAKHASLIKGKSIEEVAKITGYKGDLSQEALLAVCERTPWIYEVLAKTARARYEKALQDAAQQPVEAHE